MTNEVELLKHLNVLISNQNLPKSLLKKMDISNSDIDYITLSYDSYSRELEFVFLSNNGYDGYDIVSRSVKEIMEHIDLSEIEEESVEIEM